MHGSCTDIRSGRHGSCIAAKVGQRRCHPEAPGDVPSRPIARWRIDKQRSRRHAIGAGAIRDRSHYSGVFQTLDASSTGLGGPAPISALTGGPSV